MTVDPSLAGAHDLAVRVLTVAGATEADARPGADAAMAGTVLTCGDYKVWLAKTSYTAETLANGPSAG